MIGPRIVLPLFVYVCSRHCSRREGIYVEQITALSGPLHDLATSPPVKTLVLIVNEDEWATEPLWTVLEKKKSCSCRDSNPDRPTRIFLVYLNALSLTQTG
jgi:hypothetical protein